MRHWIWGENSNGRLNNIYANEHFLQFSICRRLDHNLKYTIEVNMFVFGLFLFSSSLYLYYLHFYSTFNWIALNLIFILIFNIFIFTFFFSFLSHSFSEFYRVVFGFTYSQLLVLMLISFNVDAVETNWKQSSNVSMSVYTVSILLTLVLYMCNICNVNIVQLFIMPGQNEIEEEFSISDMLKI